MPPLVLYHGGCNDGFCAAWVYRRQVDPAAEFRPLQFNTDPPDVDGRIVIMLDFAYERPTMLALRARAASLVVLDHHETTARELAGLGGCRFDPTRSAARLTWEFFFDPRVQGSLTRVPWLVAYTEDRDLWRWALPHSRAVNAALSSYPRQFQVWDDLARREPEDLVAEGQAILRYQEQIIWPRVRHHAWTRIGGHRVPVTNATVLTSEIGEALAREHAFAAVFFFTADNRVVYNLRSSADGLDVGAIARQYGGGGHRHAAGFTIEAVLPMEAVEEPPEAW
jgi:oligoribonuclease NrnB/cAMP/cGMP phosphodiesterase (DHH superfamily)